MAHLKRLILLGAFIVGIALLPTRAAGMPAVSPTLESCPVFPANNIWNTPIDQLPVAVRSQDYINSIGPDGRLHPDFGSGTWAGYPIGIPYNVVPGTQTKVSVDFYYPGESDVGPYPIPTEPLIEGDPTQGDRHILILDKDQCLLYELYDTWKENGSWHAGSGAIFDLNANNLRPAGWTSADAAGLPILPGLVRYAEIASGEINHALRFTVQYTRNSYLWPARHQASQSANPAYPPMGQRFRLKASFDISGFPAEIQVILRALKKYGMIVADNGSNWYISGVPDPNWNNDMLVNQLKKVPGSAFEAVDISPLLINSNSAQARQLDFKYHLEFPAIIR
jgi:hypothetical protein